MKGKKWSRGIPDAVLAHERPVRIAVPVTCGWCGANATQLLDDGIRSVRCVACGWFFLYVRMAAWLAAPTAVVHPPRRGRGRGWDSRAGP